MNKAKIREMLEEIIRAAQGGYALADSRCPDLRGDFDYIKLVSKETLAALDDDGWTQSEGEIELPAHGNWCPDDECCAVAYQRKIESLHDQIAKAAIELGRLRAENERLREVLQKRYMRG